MDLVRRLDYSNESTKQTVISIALYEEILQEPNAEQIIEHVLLFATDGRGICKRTYSERFDAFDQEIISFLTGKFAPSDKLILHDVGVSDARTSCDLFTKLTSLFPNLSFLASDRVAIIKLIKRGRIVIAINDQNEIVEITVPPFVLSAVKKRHILTPYRIIFHVLEHCLGKQMVASYLAGNITAKEIILFSPKAILLAKQDVRFTLLQHDLFRPLTEQHHVIRAMNILNSSYFSLQELRTIIRNLHDGLLEGGYLITGSNQNADSPVHGGIYQKLSGKFNEVWKINSGSPIREHILQG
jgi:hypothetical protein